MLIVSKQKHDFVTTDHLFVLFSGNGIKHHSFVFKYDRLLGHEKLHHSTHQEPLSSDHIVECK